MPIYTLSFELYAPLQSWGVQSQFGHRETMKEPTKSGVIGLLAAALGRTRDADISDLATLEMAVLVMKEGKLLRDFHTAGIEGFYRASGAVERKNPIVSTRFYLADAKFKVALQHTNKAFLESLEKALLNPIFPIYLGRKSCPPIKLQEKLCIVEQEAVSLLLSTANDAKMRMVCEEHLKPDTIQHVLIRTQPDNPVSFLPRKFQLRRTCTFHLTPNPDVPLSTHPEP